MSHKSLFLSLACAFSFSNQIIGNERMVAPYTVPVTVATTLMGALVAGGSSLVFANAREPIRTGSAIFDIAVNGLAASALLLTPAVKLLIGGVAGAIAGPKFASMLRIKLANRVLDRCDREARNSVLKDMASSLPEGLNKAYKYNLQSLIASCGKLNPSWAQEKELSNRMLGLIAQARIG